MSRKLSLALALQLIVSLAIAQTNTTTVPQMPVTTLAPPGSEKFPLLVFLSGDGGLKKFNQDMVDGFTNAGYPVIAVNSQKYFWKKKTPKEAGWDLTLVLRYYGRRWGHNTFMLVGYSLGADVLPFMFKNMPADVQAQVQQMVLISPSNYTDLEVHVSEMLGKNAKTGLNVPGAINKITTTPLLLMFGEGEDDFDLKKLKITNYEKVVLPGGHHYDDNAGNVVKTILSHPPAPAAQAAQPQ